MSTLLEAKEVTKIYEKSGRPSACFALNGKKVYSFCICVHPTGRTGAQLNTPLFLHTLHGSRMYKKF